MCIRDRYRPEFVIFGKSMVLYKEPVAELVSFIREQGIRTTVMYDMAHVLGLIGDHFQKPFEEGAEIVTGSTHKTFFGPQRGVIGVNYKEEDLKYGLWKTIESRTFPGSVSNHHLGTQLGMLMAAYEMNQFRDAYQSAIIRNAKSFARSLKSYGLDVVGDPAIDYTETHQVIVSVGYGEGAEIAEYVELDELLCRADVVSLHCPLFPETRGIINRETISKMKDGVIIINNSRGPLVVEQDLADALNSGKVYAAGLDVVSSEPISADNPLLKAKNCLITPHISWAPRESRQRIMDCTVENIRAFQAGTPKNVIN